MEYVGAKCPFVDLDTIEGFPKQIRIWQVPSVFWLGIDEQDAMKEYQELEKMSRGILNPRVGFLYVHPGNLWEMYQKWKIPYPTKYMKTLETKIIKDKRLLGFRRPKEWWSNICDNYEDNDQRNEVFFTNTDFEIKLVEEEHKTLEQALDELIPHIFAADETESRRSRFRAVRDMMLLERKIREVYLDALKRSVSRLTSSSV